MTLHLKPAEAKKLGLKPSQLKGRRKWAGHDATKSTPGAAPAIFDKLCEAHGLPIPIHEYKFCPGRKWASDYAFGELDILVEVDGGAWIEGGGRHTRGQGFEDDIEKYAEAICRGWTVLRVTPAMVEDGRLFAWLKRIKDGGE